MKTLASLVRIAPGLLALAFTLTIARAEDGAAKERKPSKEMLAKYDANKDGKLDDTEKAAMKADQEAAREARKAEKDAAREVKNAEKDAKRDARKAEREAKKSAEKDK